VRPSLRHTRNEPRQRRSQRTRRGAEPVAVPSPRSAPAAPVDLDVERVRDAGGPMDQAAYSCACGYLFSAAVSTTVSCPHCGAGQAW
jgi:hypothetical protein